MHWPSWILAHSKLYFFAIFLNIFFINIWYVTKNTTFAKKTNMNNEIVLNPQIRDFLFSHCDKVILSPSFEWLKIVETKYSNYWNATDFLHTDIEGLELVDKVQLVCLFILHGKVEIDSPIHDFKIPQDVWVYMLEHKYIKPNEHRFLFMNWNPDGFVTCANL